MTDKKISELTSITGANVSDANDVLPIVDTSAATTKKITRAELFKSVSSLTVGNTSTSGDVSIYIKGDATSRGFLMFGDSGGAQLGDIMYDHSGNYMRFRVNNSERMRIDSSGNVLCGSDGGGDIGSSTKRFKDLYLSGGVYLGGTGAANYLDGYEEGNWTGSVTVNGFTQTVSSIAGTYTKVGRLVTIHYILTLSSAGYASGYSQWAGLPFTAASVAQAGGYYATGSVSSNIIGSTHYLDASAANVYLFQSTSTSPSSTWRGSFSYYTA